MELDDWMRDEVLPLGFTTERTAGMMLMRYANNEPVGEVGVFRFYAMQSCFYAAAEIGKSIVSDPQALLSHRCTAMVELILLSIYSKSFEIDIEQVRNLLRMPAVNRDDVSEKLALSRAILVAPDLWNVLKTDVSEEVGRCAVSAGIEVPNVVSKRSLTKLFRSAPPIGSVNAPQAILGLMNIATSEDGRLLGR